MTRVAGVDACRGGWVAVVVDAGQFADSLSAPTFVQLLGRLQDARAVGVDHPIGLPSESVRAADVAARAFVGRRRSCVFPTPPRPALVAATYAEARGVLPSLSAQSFALGKKILEVEACLEERVFEVHPEVSFAALAGRPLRRSKRSWNGQMERRQLLASAGIELPTSWTPARPRPMTSLMRQSERGRPPGRRAARPQHSRLTHPCTRGAQSQSGTSRPRSSLFPRLGD